MSTVLQDPPATTGTDELVPAYALVRAVQRGDQDAVEAVRPSDPDAAFALAVAGAEQAANFLRSLASAVGEDPDELVSAARDLALAGTRDA
jgi:hypothetical protein